MARLVAKRGERMLWIGHMPGEGPKKQAVWREVFKLDVENGAQPAVEPLCRRQTRIDLRRHFFPCALIESHHQRFLRLEVVVRRAKRYTRLRSNFAHSSLVEPLSTKTLESRSQDPRPCLSRLCGRAG